MFKLEKVVILTDKYNQMILLTDRLREIVAESGIQNGLAAVITMHTTTGIAVNEAVECLESDIDDTLKRLVPENFAYAHARILPTYGSTAGNPTGHIKSTLVGNNCLFPVMDGQLVMGDAQDVYLYEFDGPAKRTVVITVTGD
ncbi:MAG: secondary thiamine-phosphate synthase enzyme YjbQ [Anaerolineaceae bacterium]|nr:secondary thiamine-phosphate synthase enzyme YjbQ [Anaerolineaceae bacterium]